jgi:LysM repeat protein
MTPCTRSLTVTALIICMVLPAWGQQYLLYVPQPVISGQKAPSQNGILVQEIEIRKGDTLYDLSRKFSGRGMYFPQILLFNSIKNPDLIRAGDTLRVPVSKHEANDTERTDTKPTAASHKSETAGGRKTAVKSKLHSPARQSGAVLPASTPGTDLSLSDLNTAGKSKNRANRQKKTPAHTKKDQLHKSPSATPSSSSLPSLHKGATVTPAVDTTTGQKLFEAAVSAYRKDDCRTALELLDRYLADNSGSPLAADANLYKAECYLKLSAQ